MPSPTSSSCIPKEPLIKLDEAGAASILNYNLPQATTYEATSYVKLDLKEPWFKPAARNPGNGYWSQLDTLKKRDDFTVNTIEDILDGKLFSSVKEIDNLALNLAAKSPKVGGDGLRLQAASTPVSTVNLPQSNRYIAQKIHDGYMPVLTNRLSGKQGLKFLKRPKRAHPAIYMVLHLRMSSYLGDYGAGQTLKTFSLLPGESTTISLRSYKQTTETSTATESVLDSYSETATDELQTTIENATQQTDSFSETDTDKMSVDTEAKAGVNLGIVELGGGASAGASSVNTTEEAIETQISALESAVDHHVQTVDTKRQIEINTETSASTTSSSESTITRSLKNINHSRVLNFVFRQLLQEYFTLTYLYDVTFIFDNGFPNRRRTANISSLGNLLRDVMKTEDAAERAENKIYEYLCNIPDHTGTQVGFIEKVEVKSKNCINPRESGRNYSYVRKRADLKQSYRDRAVDGVILGAKHRIMRTPSVIVDAVLGQGEALDCYNIQLQEAANQKAHLENNKIEQAIGIIAELSSPQERADLYQSVFGETADGGATEES